MGLRKCDRGEEVRLLQEALTQNGFPVKPTGFFDNSTDQAVRAYQERMGLLADGIAGPLTRGSLGIYGKGPCRVIKPKNELELLRIYRENSFDLQRRIGVSPNPVRARNPMASTPARSPHGMCISESGLRFIYTHETLPRVSNHLHWPKGASGVTIGPGYDMKGRSQKIIVHDLMAIGVDESTAKTVAKASGLTKDDADRFAKENKSLVNLTPEQEMQLLVLIVPDYEATVRRNIHVDLKQNEYDALVSFAYNPGYDFTGVTSLINHGQVADAMKEIGKRIKSGGKIDPSLVNRRKAEIALYVRNQYGKLRGEVRRSRIL